VEAQTDIQTYLEQGKQALAQGQGREAAIAYAHGAQMEPDNPLVHLGLAEANLALNNYGVVQMACKRVQELQPAGGKEGWTAQALLDLLDRRYDRALQNIDAVISEDPGVAYAHALRSYLLRAQGQDYDANLARARAARLSYGGRFEGCFPELDTKPVYGGYKGNTTPSTPPQEGSAKETAKETPRPTAKQEQVPTWSQPSPMRRQMVRTRFALSQYPNLVTTLLVAINVIVYLILAIMGGNIINIPENVLIQAGAQNTPLITSTGEYWRIFTAMFIHFSILHIGLNMLSLFLVGRAVEAMFGKWRYLTIYMLSGIIGGIVTFFLDPTALAAGASGAIFGVFGAIGVFFIVNRRAMGAYGNGAIGQWIFWLGLNLVWGFTTPGIGILDHIGGLFAGMVLALIFMPRQRRRSRRL
jgi:membrane associated rhomboid family serine protease